MFEQSPFSIQIFAPDGRSRRVNQAWQRLFNLDATAAAQFNVLEDPQLRAAGATGRIRQAFEGRVVAVPPVPYQIPDSSPPDTRWIGATLFPLLDEEGRVIEVVCVHEDTTERIKAGEALCELNQSLERRIAERTAELATSEARLRTLVEHAPEAIVVFDGVSGRFLEGNENAARLYGLTREELC